MFEINLDLRQKLSHKLAVKYIGSNHDLTLLNDPDALGQTLTTFRRSDQSTATFKITVTIVIVYNNGVLVVHTLLKFYVNQTVVQHHNQVIHVVQSVNVYQQHHLLYHSLQH